MKKILFTIMIVMLAVVSCMVFVSAESKTTYVGDVNDDGKVTASDARSILRHAARLELISDNLLSRADADKNNDVTAADARIVLRMAAGLEALIADHDHEYVAEEIQKQDCENNGIIEYTCSICGYSYRDETAAPGHNYVETVIQDGDCELDKVFDKTCTVCGYTKRELIEAVGHNYEKHETVEATCTEEGYTIYKCTMCGASGSFDITPKAAHSFVDANCTEPEKCKMCGFTTGEPLGHTTKNGTCDRCGYDFYAARDREIENENKKHEYNIALIEQRYSSDINITKNTLLSVMEKNGISTLYSRSYYNKLKAQITNEMSNLNARIMYSSSNSDRQYYQRQYDAKRAELQTIELALRCVELSEEVQQLENSLQYDLRDENERHESEIKNIYQKYKDSSAVLSPKPENPTPELPAESIELTEFIGKTIDEASVVFGDFVLQDVDMELKLRYYCFADYETLKLITDFHDIIVSIGYVFVEEEQKQFTLFGMQIGETTEAEFLEVLKNNKFVTPFNIVNGIDALINSKNDVVGWQKHENSDVINMVLYMAMK